MFNLKTSKIKQIFSLDLRSLAVFRIGLAIIVIEDLFSRFKALTAHYTDSGVLPRSILMENLLKPWYWSVHLISGQASVQVLLFMLALGMAICLLVGYRTRLATIATWALLISLQNRNPALIFAGDHVLRAVLFWSMFLPLGAYYSIDNAFNTSSKPLPKWICNGATIALIIQIVFIYIWSAAFKTKSSMWWPDGEAVYYSLSFDQYVTSFGQFLLSLPVPILKLLTYLALIFEWVGPLLIFIPFYNVFFRVVAIVLFILLHIGFELIFDIGSLSYLSIINWLVLIPSFIWEKLTQQLNSQPRKNLKVYYDADCDFCKKVVYLIRTFLILPDTLLRPLQEDEPIYSKNQEHNLWIVQNYLGKYYYKFDAIIYICSLSPIVGWLVPLLRIKLVRNMGTKLYELIASNCRRASWLTKPLKFRPLEINSSRFLNWMVLFLLLITSIWNLKGFVEQTVARRRQQPNDWISKTNHFLNRRTFQQIAWLPRITRLDQVWSIFAPDAPRDDGWHVIVGKLKNGDEVNAFREEQPISWDKPTLKQRSNFYQTIQWRVYFIELNRAIGKILYPPLANYLCSNWNAKHTGKQQLDHLTIYFMDERTVPRNQSQGVTKTFVIEQSCLPKK